MCTHGQVVGLRLEGNLVVYISVVIKVNMDLYRTLSWTHLWGAQVWHVFSRDLTVLLAHPAYFR